MTAIELYNYLNANHLGERHGIVRKDLANALGISERELRRLSSEINKSKEFEKLVSATHSCYICETERECLKAIRATYSSAFSLLKKAREMEKKVGLNGQIKVNLDDFKIEMVETYK